MWGILEFQTSFMRKTLFEENSLKDKHIPKMELEITSLQYYLRIYDCYRVEKLIL